MAIIEQILNEVIGGVRTPQQTPSPIEVPFIEEEVFEMKNPKLHYKYNIVQSLKELWKQCFVHSKDAEEAGDGSQPGGVSEPTDKNQSSTKHLEHLDNTKLKGTPTKGQSVDEAEEQTKQRTRSYNKVISHRVEHLEIAKYPDKGASTNKSPPADEAEEHSKQRTRIHGKVTSHQSEQKQSKEKTRSHGKRSAHHVEERKIVKPPEEAIPTNKAQPPYESEPEWDLSIDSFRQDVLTSLENEEQKGKALEQLNLKMLELSTAQINMQEDIFYKVLYQLWQEAMDELVSCSMQLREIMGLPEKETEDSVTVEEPQSKKQGRKDRRGKKGVKSAGKEDEKEKRLSAKKIKVKDDKKVVSPSSSRGSKQAATSRESPEPDQNQEDPSVQQMYREKLYTEVYGLIESMMNEVSYLFEELKGQDTEPLDKCV